MPRTAVRAWWAAAFAIACALGASFTQPLRGAQNPSLLFSTPITGGQGVRMAIDPQGHIYLAGTAIGSSNPSAFVMKLAPSRSVVYTTYFQGTRFGGEWNDCGIQINALTVDRNGAAYVAGCTTALDFPLVNPFRSTPQGSRGSGFIAKLSPAGTLVYSTYFPGYRDTAIAVDDGGHAYVAGAISDRGLPLVNAAATSGPGFVAKLSPSGTSLVYSTYIAGAPNAMAIDRSGAAYVAGTGNIGDAAVRPVQPCRTDSLEDAFVLKLNPSGSSYDYATCLGGSRFDAATGIAVDASGAAYVVGTTYSVDLPTVRPLDEPARTGPLWKTEDAGRTWSNLLVDGYSVHPILASKTSAGTWYAGSLYGAFKSSDRGAVWRRLGLPLRDSKYESTVYRLEADPHTPGTLYTSTSEGLFKSTDDGERWNAIGAALPFAGAYLRTIAVDPVDSRIVYAAAQRGFWKSVDGGATWTSSNSGLGTGPLGPEPYVWSLAVDPVTRVLYADVFHPGVGPGSSSSHRLFISIDAGATWTPTPVEIKNRFATVLTAVRARRRAGVPRPRAPGRDPSPEETPTSGPRSTVYLAARQALSEGPFGLLLRSDDGGQTWESIGEGLPAWGVEMLAVAPSHPNIVYAASRGPLFVSRDRGNTFQPLPGVTFETVTGLAVDPSNAGTVLVGTSARSDAFIAKIRPGGGSLEYSTYLGGASYDRGVGVIVDDFGRAIVFGSTESEDFPDVAALQPHRGATDAFVAVLDGGGSILLFSSSLGGTGSDTLLSMVPTGRELVISGGSTDLGSMFPASGASGAGSFVGLLNLPSGVSFRQLFR